MTRKERRAKWNKDFRAQTEIKSFGEFVALKRREWREELNARAAKALEDLKRWQEEREAERERLLKLQAEEEAKPVITIYLGES